MSPTSTTSPSPPHPPRPLSPTTSPCTSTPFYLATISWVSPGPSIPPADAFLAQVSLFHVPFREFPLPWLLPPSAPFSSSSPWSFDQILALTVAVRKETSPPPSPFFAPFVLLRQDLCYPRPLAQGSGCFLGSFPVLELALSLSPPSAACAVP
ncbi:hypothetical protein V8D89_009971 [Ganoderma adspersum]